MAIKTTQMRSNGHMLVDLTVAYDGLTVTVEAGSITYKGIQRRLVDDFEVTLSPDATHDMDVFGVLAWDTEDEELVVVVDEILRDGIDTMFDFKGSTKYDRVLAVFRTTLVPGQTTLDDGVFEIYSVVRREDQAS